MGYHTHFDGEFAIDPVLKEEHRQYLFAFSRTRRMSRDPEIVATMPDPLREAVDLPVGLEGGYYVGSDKDGNLGQNDDPSVVAYNDAPRGQPGLWCQWIPTEDGIVLEWDQGEKFYNYIDWLIYLVEHFFEPWGYTLDGEVYWEGEATGDQGILRCESVNGRTLVYVQHAQISYQPTKRVF